MKHLRNRIATTLLVAALGVAGAACQADGDQSPGQEEGVTDGGDTDDSDDGGY